MPFKTIVAIIQSAEDTERVLDCAMPLAARFEGHVIGVHAEALPVAYASTIGFPDTEFLQATASINKERAKKLEGLFRGRVEAPASPSNGAGWRAFRATARCRAFRARAAPISSSPPSAIRMRIPKRRPTSTRCSTTPGGRCWSCRMRGLRSAPTTAS